MKIVIIGAGLSGLSAAIALRKYVGASGHESLEIKIYEKPYQNEFLPDKREGERQHRLGAGLGLQSNGLRVLHDLDPNLHDMVYNSGFPCTHFKWKTSGNYLLGREYVDVLPISRPLLIDCLARFLLDDTIEYKMVTQVVSENGKRPIIRFEDGSSDETADLVVGADGVGSIVRRGLFGDEEKYRPKYTYVRDTIFNPTTNAKQWNMRSRRSA